jgi:hypothetical protein
MSISSIHRGISGETTQYTLCGALPSGLLGEAIVLEGFVGILLNMNQVQSITVR